MDMESGSVKRDVVVVGTSAGGVETLSSLVGRLPSDFPGALLVVMHVPDLGTSILARILARAANMPATAAVSGEDIEHGHIYVAPPGSHMVVLDQKLYLDEGPRENGHRPAIDPLFRSAAESFGSRVTGVILSGMLDDGVAGLARIRLAGGIAIAQDPETALFPGMPQSAVNQGAADYVLAVDEIAALLALAADGERLPPPAARPRPAGVDVDAASGFTCPECGGSLWETDEGGVERFRCHIGHAYSPESLLSMQGHRIEGALWSARAALEQRAAFLFRLGGRMRARSQERLAARYEGEARALFANAATIRQLADNYLSAESVEAFVDVE